MKVNGAFLERMCLCPAGLTKSCWNASAGKSTPSCMETGSHKTLVVGGVSVSEGMCVRALGDKSFGKFKPIRLQSITGIGETLRETKS